MRIGMKLKVIKFSSECKIYFALGVQNLFCFWSAKFILLLECKIYFTLGVQNLFCGGAIDNEPFFGNAPGSHLHTYLIYSVSRSHDVQLYQENRTAK